ncbi:hypothetical protein IC582_011236 [Cucumis melo]
MVNTPSKKGVEDPLVNIIAVATVVDDNIGCPNVKVLVDVVIGENLTILNPVKEKIETLNQALGNIIEWPCRLVSTINDKQEHSTMKDVVYSSNYTDVNGNIKLLHKHAVNNMKDVDMIHIPMNELIFGRNKFVCLAREDLLHYCGMVEIGYVFHWMLHAIDLRENCIYVLDSLWSKVNEDIHGVITVSIPKVHMDKRRLTRFEQNGQVFTLWKCGKVCWYFRCWILCIAGVYYWFAMEGSMRCLICVIICRWIYWKIRSSWSYGVEYSCVY